MNFISGTLEFLNNRKTLICDGGQTIDLVDWPDLVGSKLTMGIRPEHMELKTEKSSKEITTVLDAKVAVLEPMGHEVIVTCDSNIGEVIGKYTGNTKLKVGQKIHFEFKKENIHFFDENRGKRVS